MQRRGATHVWNMLMKAHLNDCLRMHVRTNAGLWICDRLNVVLWCSAFFSRLWWIYCFTLHTTLAVFHIMIMSESTFWPPNSWALLRHHDSFCLQPLFEKQYQPSLITWWACQKKPQSVAQCTVRGFKAWRKPPKATLLKSQALVTITANSLPKSTQPL